MISSLRRNSKVKAQMTGYWPKNGKVSDHKVEAKITSYNRKV